MRTTWEHSLKTEAERLIQYAHQMITNFYRVNSFLVLPYIPKAVGVNIVAFPDLPYRKIPRFWKKAKKVQVQNYPLKIDNKLREQVENLLKVASLEKIKFEQTEKLWNKTEDSVIKEIYKLIPDTKNKIKKITIYPTLFGTSTSFNWFDPNKGEIIMHLRQDCGVYEITEAILSSLTRKDIYQELNGIWQESEIITDWLLTKSSLSKVLEKYSRLDSYTPTTKGIRIKQHAKLLAESEEFYKKLGIPTNEKVFNLNGLTPEIYKKPVENLSAKEKILLRLLVQKSGGVITIDEIGENLFKDENDFSLYAISKTVERLRSKLEQNGISGSYIQTLRGQGYVLKN